MSGYADTQWSSTTPPPEFLECVGEWIRGYAVEFDHPSPRIFETSDPAVTKSWKAEKLIWKNWCDVFSRTKNTHS